jgi:signal transduction histidine kinase
LEAIGRTVTIRRMSCLCEGHGMNTRCASALATSLASIALAHMIRVTGPTPVADTRAQDRDGAASMHIDPAKARELVEQLQTDTTAEPSAGGNGTGLRGMADRLDAIGGSLLVQRTPGSGTTVTVSVPAHGSAS